MIRPGQLVNVGYLRHARVGLFIRYNDKVKEDSNMLNTCEVLLDESISTVFVGFVDVL